MTPDQEKQFIRFILDILDNSGRKNEPAVDRILARGDQLKAILLPAFNHLGAEVALVNSAILEPVKIINFPIVEAFSAKKKFAIGTQDDVVIGTIGCNFNKHLLNDAGKSEVDVPAMDLRIHKLRKRSMDGPIIAELGGEEIVETKLATVWELMKKQGSGQAGDLLVDGSPNIFYIRDNFGILWSVSCRWRVKTLGKITDVRSWRVGALRKATDPKNAYYSGTQVFSR